MIPGPLHTTVTGSYPQPEWLIDRARLAARLPPRVAARELWRIHPDELEEAQDAATLLAVRDMEDAGVDVVTDGEIRRESYSNRFANALGGSTSTIPAPPWTGPATPTRSRAWSGRSGARGRSRCATSNSCAPPPTGPSGSPCPGPSR